MNGFDVAPHLGGAIELFVAEVTLDFDAVVNSAHVRSHVSQLRKTERGEGVGKGRHEKNAS